jgi:hypothetical protein
VDLAQGGSDTWIGDLRPPGRVVLLVPLAKYLNENQIQ